PAGAYRDRRRGRSHHRAAGRGGGGGCAGRRLGGVPGRFGVEQRTLWREHPRHPRGRRGRPALIWRGATALAGGALDLTAPLAGADWRERLALSGPDAAPGGIWLHAASLG